MRILADWQARRVRAPVPQPDGSCTVERRTKVLLPRVPGNRKRGMQTRRMNPCERLPRGSLQDRGAASCATHQTPYKASILCAIWVLWAFLEGLTAGRISWLPGFSESRLHHLSCEPADWLTGRWSARGRYTWTAPQPRPKIVTLFPWSVDCLVLARRSKSVCPNCLCRVLTQIRWFRYAPR